MLLVVLVGVVVVLGNKDVGNVFIDEDVNSCVFLFGDDDDDDDDNASATPLVVSYNNNVINSKQHITVGLRILSNSSNNTIIVIVIVIALCQRHFTLFLFLLLRKLYGPLHCIVAVRSLT